MLPDPTPKKSRRGTRRAQPYRKTRRRQPSLVLRRMRKGDDSFKRSPTKRPPSALRNKNKRRLRRLARGSSRLARR